MRVYKECEILVVGGGFSGIAASVTAARAGKKTVLIERSDRLGGCATAAMHQSICGLYGVDAKEAKDTLNEGIPREIVLALQEDQSARGFERIGQVAVFSYDGKTLRRLFRAMMDCETSLDRIVGTELVAIESRAQGIRSVTIQNTEATMCLTPKCVIDCTGNGLAIRLSGAAFEMEPPEKRQMAGIGFRLVGVDSGAEGLGLKVAYALATAAAAEKLAPQLRWSVWTQGVVEGEGVLKLSVPSLEPPKPIEALWEDGVRVHRCLAEAIPEFKDSRMAKMGGALAEREGLRMVGDYTLTEEDVLNARTFSDGVVRNAWPIEFWSAEKGPRYQYVENGGVYEIPARCLHSNSVSNLFSSGRFISATSRALASTRASGNCLALGEQSAKAAITFLHGGTALC